MGCFRFLFGWGKRHSYRNMLDKGFVLRRRAMTLRWRLAIAMIFQAGWVTIVIGVAAIWSASLTVAVLVGFVGGLPSGIMLAFWAIDPWLKTRTMLRAATAAFHDNDHGLKLAAPEDPDLASFVSFFNRLTRDAHEKTRALYQKELLLDTVIQKAPMAIMIFGPTNRLILANREAHVLFPVKGMLLGRHRDDLIQHSEPALGEVLLETGDSLLSLKSGEDAETYHVTSRWFRINGLSHQLVLVKYLTKELRRQEVVTWKKIIRLINHELNNTLAPLRSLLHSARMILSQPDHHEKLPRVLDGMDQATLHLKRFLEDYATFARLPMPRLETVNWDKFLEGIRTLVPCDVENRVSGKEGWFDPAQMQQALINLLKNAREASETGGSVRLSVYALPDGRTMIEVRDYGRGMSEEAMQKALLPFYSTKKRGTGLGLPLCREIFESHGGGIRLQRPEDGGLAVLCWLPPREPL